MIGIYRDKGEQAMEEERREKARRLSRYDEAVRLLRMSEHARPESLFFRAYEIKRDKFLADEPKEGRG